jgi:hypothetical protein
MRVNFQLQLYINTCVYYFNIGPKQFHEVNNTDLYYYSASRDGYMVDGYTHTHAHAHVRTHTRTHTHRQRAQRGIIISRQSTYRVVSPPAGWEMDAGVQCVTEHLTSWKMDTNYTNKLSQSHVRITRSSMFLYVERCSGKEAGCRACICNKLSQSHVRITRSSNVKFRSCSKRQSV